MRAFLRSEPMTPKACNQTVLTPALALLPARMDSIDARRTMLAIGLQESELTHRRQHGNGPARGIFQFEPGKRSALGGIFRLESTREHAVAVCGALGVDPHWQAVYVELEHSDILAACFARLLLWSDPAPLPSDEAGAWGYYTRVWRPGRPRIDHWPKSWAAASEAISSACYIDD